MQKNNISSNIGSNDSVVFQDNGTKRLKGSYPKIIANRNDIVVHIKNQLNIHKRYGTHSDFSRFSIRYFVSKDITMQLKEKLNQQIDDFYVQVECIIPIVNQSFSWVWIGGNINSRKTDPKLLNKMHKSITNFLNKDNPILTKTIPSTHESVLFGSKSRISSLNPKHTPSGVKTQEINMEQSTSIANLFKTRMPTYITNNSDPNYIIEIASNTDTFLFCAINNSNKQIEAVVANEITEYPYSNDKLKASQNIRVCETNDWIKSANTSKQVMENLLFVALQNAVLQNCDIIEAECMPNSFSLCGKAGFVSTDHPLERTSIIKTDIENEENFDTSISEKYRDFNSLFLGVFNTRL
ncbi:MAG: hypothetical protein M3P33_02050 [bacterium]|nr:hypothetical protein [bacterium]